MGPPMPWTKAGWSSALEESQSDVNCDDRIEYFGDDDNDDNDDNDNVIKAEC